MARSVTTRGPLPAAVIFDLDGVLADTHPLHRKAWQKMLREKGRHVSARELDFVLEGWDRERILRHFLDGLSALERRHCGWRKDELFEQLGSAARPLPGVLNLLQQIEEAGVATAIATSAGGHRCRELLRQLGLAGRFQVVVTRDDVPRAKPDPHVFRLAAAGLRVAPQRCLVLEDSVAGVQAARAAGMFCMAVARNGNGARLRRHGAQHILPGLESVVFSDLARVFRNHFPPGLCRKSGRKARKSEVRVRRAEKVAAARRSRAARGLVIREIS